MNYAAFIKKYPDFLDFDEELVTELIEESTGELNKTLYTAKYERAIFLLVAHKLTLREKGTVSIMPVVSRTTDAGSVSVLNVSKSWKEIYYSSTSYGVEFLSLKSVRRFVGAIV